MPPHHGCFAACPWPWFAASHVQCTGSRLLKGSSHTALFQQSLVGLKGSKDTFPGRPKLHMSAPALTSGRHAAQQYIYGAAASHSVSATAVVFVPLSV